MALFKVQKTLAPKRGFSLVELLVVITIVGILGAVSFVAIQRTKTRSLNERMLDDLVAIANALEDYRQDHQGSFPIPTAANNQNVLCFFADATYADCEDADVSFIQGMIDNNLLTKRYLREVPTDPRTGSRYVYGVSEDGKYYQVAGLYEASAGFEARTVGNLAKGFELPSLIRAYDGPNFVVDGEDNLPYPSDRMTFTGTLDNINGTLWVNGSPDNVRNGLVVKMGDTLKAVGSGSSVDIYLSDGSVTHLESGDSTDGELILKSLSVEKNDSSGTVTKILLKLNLGKIWSKVARLASASEFRVETSSAIAGVRGTEFGVEEFGGTTPWNIRVKSGKVWGGRKADLASTLGIQNLAVEDVAPEVVFSMPKPELSSPLIYTDPANILDPTDPVDAAYYAPYYASIALTSNHRPHILSVAPGTLGHSVTVRNVNFFANQINERLGITDPAQKRHVRVTRLAVYDASTIDSATPTLITATGDISTQQTGIYTLNIASPLPLALRFELCSNHPLPAQACDLVRASSVATLPALTSSTDLTEAQLYPNLAPSAEGLSISAPDTVALIASGSAQTFPVVISGGQNPNLTADASSTSDCSPANNTLVTFTRAGTCVLNVTATLSNGASATATKTVTLMPATAVLSLGQPVYADVGVKRYATIPWSANNPPVGARFASKLNSSTQQTVPSPMKFEVAPGTQYVVWLIMYRDTSGNGGYNAGVDEELETASVQFTVPSGSNPSADFTINPPIPQPVSGNAITTFNFSAPQVPVAIDTNLYDYVWAGATSTVATPQYATLELQVPQAGATATGTVTLTIRDKANRNVLATQTKSVSVNRLPEISAIAFNPTSMAATAGTPAVITARPVATVTGGATATLELLDCSSLSAMPQQGAVMNGEYLTQASDTFRSDTITCVLAAGERMVGNVRYAVPSELTAALAVVVSAAPAQDVCGDGALTGSETCDGNFFAAQSTCATGAPTCTNCQFTCVAQAVCGNGIIENQESCDDGNIVATDGCSGSCSLTQNPDYSCHPTTLAAPYDTTNPQTVCTLTPEAKCVGLSGVRTSVAGGSSNTTLGTYFENGSCWALGAAGLNCTDACNALDNASSGVDMSCDSGLDWNDCGANGTCGAQIADADDCQVCKAITGSTACSFDTHTFEPITILTSSGTNLCKYRQSSTQDCGTIPTTTFQGATAKRVCKCQ